jgi:predicted Ser/Thr protein kinase
MSLSSGTRLGHYEILEPLGKGGMGEVYRARDTKLDREVAIKILPEVFAADAERLARFEREAKVLAALNHPNIAQIYGVEDRALVMELVEGESLKGPLPVETALIYSKQIAEALEAAHEKGITHRDLKPSNVMITREGVVKVLDFGLAAQSREHEGDSTLTMSPTRAGMIMGTVAYMSPEQARGQVVDRRADIWAFGAVLYEMLTGKQAFTGDTASDILAAVLKNEPDLKAIPRQMRKLVARCLTKDRKMRLQAIGDWRLLTDDGAPPVRAGLAWRGWLAAAALVVIAVVLGFALWRATRPVAHPLMNLSVDLGPDAVLGGTGTSRVALILSPDGTRLVYRSRGGLSTRQLDQAKSTPLAGTEGADDPFFSPDGQWIGFFANGKLKKISVQGGAAVTLCDAPNEHGGSWGEDGNIVFAPSPRAGLSRVSEAGGTPQPLTQLDEQKGELTHRDPLMLPGGQAVLFTASSNTADFNEATVEVLSLKTGQRKTLQRGGFFGRYLPTGHLVYMQRGTLFAAPMDLKNLALTGPAVPLLDDLATNPTEADAQFDFSQSGTFVYASGKAASTGWSIAWLDSTGKTQPLKGAPGAYFNPSFSPDGKRLAFSLNINDILVYDWQRDTTSRLTFTPGVNNWPVWTPDGRGIVYRSAPGGIGNLYWVRSDGAAAAVRLTESKNDQIPYSFSPDGKRLAFTERDDTTLNDIWTLPIDWSDPEHPKAGQPEVFLRTPAIEFAPAFSPDGKWLAYVAVERPNQEVYVRPFPADPSGGKWQISSGGGQGPIWSRGALGAGRELFYQGPNGIMVVSYAAKGSTFVADKPRLWSDHRILNAAGGKNYDLAPDGKRFAVLEPPEAEEKPETQVNVLLNFFDEVRRRAPPGK